MFKTILSLSCAIIVSTSSCYAGTIFPGSPEDLEARRPSKVRNPFNGRNWEAALQEDFEIFRQKANQERADAKYARELQENFDRKALQEDFEIFRQKVNQERDDAQLARDLQEQFDLEQAQRLQDQFDQEALDYALALSLQSSW